MTIAQQHRYEVGASNLLYLTFLISVVTDFLLGCGYFAPHKSIAQYGMLYGATPLLLFVYYKIRQGLRGAKTFFLVCYALVVLQILSDGVSPSAYDTELKAFSLAAQHTAQLLACVLLLLSMRTPAEPSLEVA